MLTFPGVVMELSYRNSDKVCKWLSHRWQGPLKPSFSIPSPPGLFSHLSRATWSLSPAWNCYPHQHGPAHHLLTFPASSVKLLWLTPSFGLRANLGLLASTSLCHYLLLGSSLPSQCELGILWSIIFIKILDAFSFFLLTYLPIKILTPDQLYCHPPYS